MKILFFIEHLGVGGVMRQVSILADPLGRRGHDVSLVALYTLDPYWNLVSKVQFAVLTEKRTLVLVSKKGF